MHNTFASWKKLVPATALSILLAACGAAPKKTTDLNQSIEALAQTHVTTEKLESIPSRRIAIASFGVEFQTKLLHSASRFGSTSSSTTILNLTGVTPTTMQAVTNSQYQKLISDLQAAGYEIVPQAELEKNAIYQKIVKNAAATPVEISFQDPTSKSFSNSKAVVYAPTGLKYYAPSTEEAGTRLSTLGKAFGDIGANFTRGGSLPDVERDLAKELNASLLKVYYVVGFGQAKASVTDSSSSTWHGSKASTGIEIIGKGETHFSFRNPSGSNIHMTMAQVKPPMDGHAFVRLEEYVNAGLPFLAEDVYNSTSTSNKVGNALSQTLSIVGALGGINAGSANTQEFTAPADDALYGQSVGKQLDAVQAMLLYRLKQGK